MRGHSANSSVENILYGRTHTRQAAPTPKWLPKMYPVKQSSNVHSIGYDHHNNSLYAVLGPEKRIYKWKNVSEEIWQQFQVSPSKGKFVHKYLVGQYESEYLHNLDC